LGTATLNVSDANPRSIPSFLNPFANQSLVGLDFNKAYETNPQALGFLNALFAETGATQGNEAVLQIQQALHTPGGLHSSDNEPLRIYAGTDAISGLKLYSPKV
jgi:hypothetical protein